jgi:hypothetical protein
MLRMWLNTPELKIYQFLWRSPVEHRGLFMVDKDSWLSSEKKPSISEWNGKKPNIHSGIGILLKIYDTAYLVTAF